MKWVLIGDKNISTKGCKSNNIEYKLVESCVDVVVYCTLARYHRIVTEIDMSCSDICKDMYKAIKNK